MTSGTRTAGILFDLDETLLDRAASIADYAERFYADFAAHIGMPRRHFVAEFLRLDGNGYVRRADFFDGLARYIDSSTLDAAHIAAHFAENAWKRPFPMAGAKEGLVDLRNARLPLGIITNGGSRNQRQKLVNSGLVELVDLVVVSEEFGVKKPDPSIFLSACGR